METSRFDTPDAAKRCLGKELTPEFLDALDYCFQSEPQNWLTRLIRLDTLLVRDRLSAFSEV